ncbi:MAG: hypothetical protein L0Z62_11360 [Gemmataceae bacterium]|nr:hypothetical protein [Gemmataceae bacterium]
MPEPLKPTPMGSPMSKPGLRADANKELKRNLIREQVVILTENAIIEGNLYHHQDMRLSDALNAPAVKDHPYLALVDVTVTRIATGQEILTSQFLLVQRSKIEVILPRAEILTFATPARHVEAHAPA